MADRTAKKRKAEFDRIMRNRGQLVDRRQPERSPVQLYLSDQAREAIVQHRRERQATGYGARLDSIFVDEAIIHYRKNSSLATPRVEDSEEVVDLRYALKRANIQIEEACRSFHASRWTYLDGNILRRHELAFGLEFQYLVRTLLDAVDSLPEGPELSRALHRAVGEYIDVLRTPEVKKRSRPTGR